MEKISIAMPDGTSEALLWLPPNPRHAVLWSCDALGIRPAPVAQAEKLASWGVAVLMPNLFWRYHQPPFLADGSTVGGENDEFAKAGFQQYQAYDFDHLGVDVPVWAETLLGASELDTLSFIGFCMGGRVGVRVAAALGERCTRVTAFHPGGLVREDDPGSEHLLLDQVACPIYLGYADNDAIATPEQQAAFTAAASAAGVDLTEELYPGALHGYMMADRPVFNADAAARGWSVLEQTYGQGV